MNELHDKIINVLSSFTETEKDAMYRYLWEGHVKEDVISYISGNEEYCLTNDQIDNISYRFVYCGDYDCNLFYWDNIENLIREECTDM